jgi:hypothetical protein
VVDIKKIATVSSSSVEKKMDDIYFGKNIIDNKVVLK